MRLINFLYLIAPFICNMGTAQNTELNQYFFVCYGKIKPSLVKGYKIVILESAHYNVEEIALFKQNNDKVVAYISVTEVNEYSNIYNKVKGTTIGKNENWNSYYLDLKLSQTLEALQQEIRALKKKGFNGIFLDNLDNVSKWGMLKENKQELIDFIKSIKAQHKDFFIVQNAGLFMTQELEESTDAIVIESVFSNYDFNTKKYKFRDVASTNIFLTEIRELKEKTAKPLLLIEYTDNVKMKKILQKKLKALNVPFFIGNIELQGFLEFKKGL